MFAECSQTLRQKGVATDDIDAGMLLAFGDTDCSISHEDTFHEDTFEEQPMCECNLQSLASVP
jgi:hypothetical protein